MAVYKRSYKSCPACDRAKIATTADGWRCRSCSATFAVDEPKIVNQTNEQWRYRKWVTLPSGERVRVCGTPTINTKRAAEEAERAHVERVLNPPPIQRERKLMSDVFDLFLDEYVATANNKGSEVAAKEGAVDNYLRPELGKLHADEVTDARVDELAAKLHKTKKLRGKGTLSAKYVKNVLQTLRKCLNWAAKRKWIDRAPAFEMPRVDQAEIRFLTDPELDAMLEAVASEPLWRAAVLLAVDAGLRQGELRALKWTDYNEVTKKLVISRSRWRNEDSSTKSRKPRTVPMTGRLVAAMRAIRDTRLRGQPGQPGGPYVLSRASDGGAFGAEYMTETIDRLARKAKLDAVGWHTLRHTFCSRLAMRGARTKQIQELAGHANIATTERYMHLAPGAVDQAIALLDDGEGARSGRAVRAASANES